MSRILSLLSYLFFFICTSSFTLAQLSTVYVDITNGSDTYSGANPTNTPAGKGPKATLHAGLSAIENNGKLVIFAGVYPGDGIDTDGSPSVTTDNADIEISYTKYTRLVNGLTIELRALGGNNEIRILTDANSVKNQNGALITHTADQYIPNFIFNIPNGTLAIAAGSGVEYLSLAQAHSNGSPVAGLSILAGSVGLNSSSLFRLRSGSTITLHGLGGFSSQAPEKGTDLSLIYHGAGNVTAGPESRYGDYGKGNLTVNRNLGSTITFPAQMIFVGEQVPSGTTPGNSPKRAISISSGHAVFNGSVDIGSVGSGTTAPSVADIVVTGSGSAAFNSSVSLVVGAASASRDSAISTIENQGPGSLTFSGSVTWRAAYNAAGASVENLTFPAGASTSLVRNTSSGTIHFASTVELLTNSITNQSGDAYFGVSIENAGSGSLAFSNGISAPNMAGQISGNRNFTVNVLNSSSGTLTISGILRGAISNIGDAGGTIVLNGQTEIYQALKNASGKTISLGSSLLLLARKTELPLFNNGAGGTTSPSPLNHVTNGGTITATSGRIVIAHTSGVMRFDGGTLGVVSITGSGGTTEFHSNAVSLDEFVLANGTATTSVNTTISRLLSISGGSFQSGDGVMVRTLNFTQIGGLVALGGGSSGTLYVHGNFERTAGSFDAGVGSSILFQGNTFQNFNPGNALQLRTIVFDNTASPVVLGQSVFASEGLQIKSGTNLSLGQHQIILNGDGAVVTNAGTYSTDEGGGIVMGGASLQGGRTITGASLTAEGSGAYSTIVVDVGTSNSVTTTGNVRFTNLLNLNSGSIRILSGNLGPTGSLAKLIRNVATSQGIVLSGGMFNADNIIYDLEYTGALTADVSTGSELFGAVANTRSWTINVNSDVTDGDANLLTGTIHYYQLPVNGFLYSGALTIGPLAAVRVAADGNAGDVLELSGSGISHALRGSLTTVDAGDYILVSGAVATLIGSANTNEAAVLGDIVVSSTTLCSISGIHSFAGAFTARPNSIISLGMGSSTSSQATLASQQRISGALTLDGKSFSLTSSIEARGGVTFNSGTLNFGSHDLQLTTTGNFSQSDGALGYTSSGGHLVMNRTNATLAIGNSSSNALPNLRILSNTVLARSGRVSTRLQIGSTSSAGIPTLRIDTNDLTFAGSEIVLSDDGSSGGNSIALLSNEVPGIRGGSLVIVSQSSTITANGSFSIEELTLSPTNGAGVCRFASSSSAQRELIIADVLTQSGGELALGANHLSLRGIGAGASLRAYNRSGGTITATTGEVRFSGAASQQFDPGIGLSIPNLTLDNASGVSSSNASQAFTVTSRLDLTNGTLFTDPGTLVLGSNATVVRRRTSARLNSTPSFSSSVNVSYLVDPLNGDLVTGRELPTTSTALGTLVISNANTSETANNVTLDKSVTVNGTLSLAEGELDLGSSDLTMAAGSTLNIGHGRFETTGGATDAPIVTSYHLVYSAGTAITASNREFPSGSSISVHSLSVQSDVNGNTTTVIFHQPRTVADVTINSPGGGISLGAPGSFVSRNLTVTGNITISAGGFLNTTGTSALIDLAGPQHQFVAVPSDGLILQGGASAINLRLNNAAGFTLQGGNLTFQSGAAMIFVNGVLNAESGAVIFSQTQTGQGFDRSAVVGNTLSHIRGKVRHFISGGAGNPSVWPNGRYEFPIGTATHYRPLTLTFTSTYPAINPTSVEVAHVEATPEGTIGLPLDGGTGVRIGSYSPYYWLVRTTPTNFSASQQFDLEIQGTNPGQGITRSENLRIVRRLDGSPSTNPWQLQGTGLSYPANSVQIPTPGDTIVIVRALSAVAALSTQGNRFAIGFPTRAPVWGRVLPDTTIDEGQTLSFTYLADPLDAGESVTYSLINPPAGATMNASTGELTWIPSFSQAGTYSVVASATDGQFTITTTASISVRNVNRRPVFVTVLRDTSIRDTQDTLRFRYTASDPDGDLITFSLIEGPGGMEMSSDGLLTWVPMFTQVGQNFVVRVRVSDGSAVDSTRATVSAIPGRKKGDVSADSEITSFDASLILRHVTGISLIIDPAALYAADVSSNGSVTAYDASLILQFVAGIISTFPRIVELSAQMSGDGTSSLAPSNVLRWGEFQTPQKAGIQRVGLNLASEVNDVYAIQVVLRVDDAQATLEGITSLLPKDWSLYHQRVNGELRIAMAGATPLRAGEFIHLAFRKQTEERSQTLRWEGMVNETPQIAQPLVIQAVPLEFGLDSNYPNPFNPSTTIKYRLADEVSVRLEIYNVAGQKIRTLVNEIQKAAFYSVEWDGKNDAGESVATGMYLYRIQAGSRTAVRKMLMIR